MFKVAVVLAAAITVALAAQGIGPLFDKPEKFKDVQGCYIPDLDQVIPFGGKAPAKSKCMQYTCGNTLITYHSCGAVAAQPPLKVVADDSQPYPGCCPKIVGPA